MHVSHVDADTLYNLQDSRTAVERETVYPDALHGRVHSFDKMSGCCSSIPVLRILL
jgi:hypothetical protein